MLQWDLPRRSRRVVSIPQAERRLPIDGARQEGPEALPQPRAGGVLGGGDFDVVAAVVLDEEVAVAGLGEGDSAEPLLGAGALVAELVGGVDRDPADHRHRQRQADVFDQREIAARPHPAGEDETGVLDRDEDVGAPAVVAVLLEELEDAVGRVGRIEPDRHVEQREEAEDESRAEEPDPAEAGERDPEPGEERRERDDDPQQPGVALAVGPGRRIDLDVLVMVVMRVLRVCLHAPSLSNARCSSPIFTQTADVSSAATAQRDMSVDRGGPVSSKSRRAWGQPPEDASSPTAVFLSPPMRR